MQVISDRVIETDEVNDVMQISYSENDLADAIDVIGQSVAYTEIQLLCLKMVVYGQKFHLLRGKREENVISKLFQEIGLNISQHFPPYFFRNYECDFIRDE